MTCHKNIIKKNENHNTTIKVNCDITKMPSINLSKKNSTNQKMLDH